MRTTIITVAILLGALNSIEAQEKVMSILKTNGSSSKTRVAELDQIKFLPFDINHLQQPSSETQSQPATMIMKLINGAQMRTSVDEVKDISFADTLYHTNSMGQHILETDELFWPDDRLLPHLLPPASTIKTLDMPAARLGNAERVMFCTLQGIVNRTCPRILLYNHNEEPQSTWPSANGLRTSAISTGNPYELVKSYMEELNGLVLYTNELSDHYANLAVTIGGLDRLLPVTPEVKEKLEANGIQLPVKVDLTQLTMSTATDIYTYLYDNYWKRCNHRLLISLNPTIPYVHDIGAACGSACVWLDPRIQSERNVLDKMLTDMTPGRDIVLGWYPEERPGVGEATRYGLSTVPADFFENATIYSAVNKPIKIAPVPKRPKLENKIYAAVYISDGDNIQYCQHAMAKIFEQGGRGQMPMNWTISPALADIAPGMLNYYYGKASTNDCFVCGPSGLGYAMPYDAHNKVYYSHMLKTELFDKYTQLTQRYLEKTGLRIITIWDNISNNQGACYAKNCSYLYGLTINDWERQNGRLTGKIQSGSLPIAPLYPCYANSADVVNDFFNRDISNFDGKKPMFVTGQVTVWDVGPDKLVALKEKLNTLSPGNVSIVRADHWFSYYREANHMPFNLTMLEDMTITSSAAKTPARYAADGSPSTGNIWISRMANQQSWILMDFKEPYEISRYVIRHAETSGLDAELNTRDFTMEISMDGETWTTIGTHTGNTAPVTDVTITPRQARYVRLNVTNGGADGYVRIGDIEIEGMH